MKAKWTKRQVQKAAKQTLERYEEILNNLLGKRNKLSFTIKCGYCEIDDKYYYKYKVCSRCINIGSCTHYTKTILYRRHESPPSDFLLINIFAHMIYHWQALRGEVFEWKE